MNKEITDFPPIPKFLDRTDGLTHEQNMKNLHAHAAKVKGHPGSKIVMPDYRHNPTRQSRGASRQVRTIVKGTRSKTIYPTTEAVVVATAGLMNGEKRKSMYAIARENGINPSRWDALNNGQVAMNLTNTLRGRYYKMQRIMVQGKEVK